jgi:transaldolase
MKQSLWLDDITRQMLEDGRLQRYVEAWGITGITSNPSTFDKAIAGGKAYDHAIAMRPSAIDDETLFTELALEDLCRAADLLRSIHDATEGMDGWVSMEVSPVLVDDADATIEAATRIHTQAARPNLLVKIPGTAAGCVAIEECIFRGIPINVTLLFSREHYVAAAEAYLRGVQRRLAAGLSPRVGSVASMFVSRWDKASDERLPVELRHQLGLAMAGRTYHAYRELLASARWRQLEARGARAQRLLWASTAPKSPGLSPTWYADALVAPDTIDTLPETTLRAFIEKGGARTPMPEDGVAAEQLLGRIRASGIDLDALASRLQREGAEAFLESWRHLLQGIRLRRAAAPE